MTSLAAPHSPSTPTSAPDLLDTDLLDDVRDHAAALDRGGESSRRAIPALGERGLLALGAPDNRDGGLAAQADVLRTLASRDLSTAFTAWATRVTVEYLAAADTGYARRWLPRLTSGEILGVTGMASAFKDLAGCGSVDLTATTTDTGYAISSTLRWASNLHEDSLLVTAARTEDGTKLLVALPLDTPGVRIGAPFDLLALGSTASSSVTLEGAEIGADQVLSADLPGFLTRVRPTFVALQSALCLGLAEACLAQARVSLVGVTSVFAGEVATLDGRLALLTTTLRRLASAVGGDDAPTRKELLSLRLAAAELATAASGVEIRTAGGKGYASGTPTSRRFREATFIPLQSPSEAQLRWELATLG